MTDVGVSEADEPLTEEEGISAAEFCSDASQSAASGNHCSRRRLSRSSIYRGPNTETIDEEINTVITHYSASGSGERLVTSVNTDRRDSLTRTSLPSQGDEVFRPNKDSNNIISGTQLLEEDIMGENARVEEKLRQFQNNRKADDNESTRGTYSMLSELEKQRRRNLIFDEERFEEAFLKCLICREVYNEVDKLPKMLHCHHTFCMDCLYQMYRVEGEFRQTLTGVFRSMPMAVKIQCPTCREGFIISEPEIRRLPNDHTIMELLTFVSKTGKNDVQFCTKHQMQPLNFFCEPCIMPVCCDCTVIDHKESKGHVVVNVDEAMKKYSPIVEETLGDIRCEKASLAEKRESLDRALCDLDAIQRNLNSQIRAVFDNIREILDEREKELYSVSEMELDRKREVIDGHLKVLMDRECQLNTEFNELQKAKDDRDISQVFSGHKSARETLAKKVHVPTQSAKGFSANFQFSSRSDAMIKQYVGNLGDIVFKT